MKAAIGLVSFALAIGIAPAEAIDLTCRGEMHYYEAKNIEVTIPPGAVIVDLEKRSIITPLGDFRITEVSEGSISFTDPAERVDRFRHPRPNVGSNESILAKSQR